MNKWTKQPTKHFEAKFELFQDVHFLPKSASVSCNPILWVTLPSFNYGQCDQRLRAVTQQFRAGLRVGLLVALGPWVWQDFPDIHFINCNVTGTNVSMPSDPKDQPRQSRQCSGSMLVIITLTLCFCLSWFLQTDLVYAVLHGALKLRSLPPTPPLHRPHLPRPTALWLMPQGHFPFATALSSPPGNPRNVFRHLPHKALAHSIITDNMSRTQSMNWLRPDPEALQRSPGTGERASCLVFKNNTSQTRCPGPTA